MPASSKKPSSAREWKRSKHHEITLPSGHVALVKRPGPEIFLAEGLLPDSLSTIVQKAIRTGQGLPPEETKKMAEDPEKIQEMMDAIDRVAAKVVVEPTLNYHRATPTQGVGAVIPMEHRDEDALYTDDVDFEDKVFIFNFAVGGSRDLDRFRREAASGVGDVQSVSVDEVSAVGTRSGAARGTKKSTARSRR